MPNSSGTPTLLPFRPLREISLTERRNGHARNRCRQVNSEIPSEKLFVGFPTLHLPSEKLFAGVPTLHLRAARTVYVDVVKNDRRFLEVQ